MTDGPALPDDVRAFYSQGVELKRLTTGEGALEFERTKELVLRFLPEGSAIADVGGAFGHYAEWLTNNGHHVDLVDPVPFHLDRARERAGEPARFRVYEGDARALPLSDSSYDAVLLLGPLYHLSEPKDRARCLTEAFRVCRTDGIVFAAAISRFAPFIDTLRRGTIADDRVFRTVASETETGRRVGRERRVTDFPDAHFHRPNELAQELLEAGFAVEGIYGVEGPGWLFGDLEERWRDPVMRERLLWSARIAETDPEMRSISAHLLGVARKTTGVIDRRRS